ncbi:hypothetical protein L3Q82_019400, partial [Scortum barcoo]
SQMETSSQGRVGGGLWNNPRAPQYSKETQDMLRLMMQESRLTNLQRKQIDTCLKNGEALPLISEPSSSASPCQPKTSRSVQKRQSSRPQRRSAESCRSGNSYVREKFQPGPIKSFSPLVIFFLHFNPGDLEKEKRRLQNLLATGQEEPTAPSVSKCKDPGEGRDLYQEVLDEIEERRQFLADMAALGKERPYVGIINSEISQRIRELELLDKARSNKDTTSSESKEATVGQMTENTDFKETEER